MVFYAQSTNAVISGRSDRLRQRQSETDSDRETETERQRQRDTDGERCRDLKV